MTRCRESAQLQDYLDGLLSGPASESFRRHLVACAECTAELAWYRALIQKLERLPVVDPGVRMTERILAAVVPARLRRRWVRAFGWAYAGALSGSIAAVALVVSLPGVPAWWDAFSAALPRHLVQAMALALNTLGFVTLGLANGWGAITTMGERLAPFVRAAGSLLGHPRVEVALWAAGVICVALMWWLHGRERSSRPGMDPLGLLGV